MNCFVGIIDSSYSAYLITVSSKGSISFILPRQRQYDKKKQFLKTLACQSLAVESTAYSTLSWNLSGLVRIQVGHYANSHLSRFGIVFYKKICITPACRILFVVRITIESSQCEHVLLIPIYKPKTESLNQILIRRQLLLVAFYSFALWGGLLPSFQINTHRG